MTCLCDTDRIRLLCRGAKHQHEFVATHARHGVDLVDHAAQPRGDAIQQLVARVMAERVVDELEAIEVEHQDGELLAVVLGVHHGLVETIVEQDAIGQSGERIVRRQVAQLVVRHFEAHGADRDHVLERLQLAAHHLLVVPLARQRARTLQDFDGLERLLQDQEFVRVAQPLEEVGPVIVRVRGADHHLHVRIGLPQVFDGLEPVPTRRHAHVDEGECEGMSVWQAPAGRSSHPGGLAGRTATRMRAA